MADINREEIILEIARLMWRRELSIAEFYATLGIDLEEPENTDPTEVVSMLAGVFTGWKNPPTKAPVAAPAAA